MMMGGFCCLTGPESLGTSVGQQHLSVHCEHLPCPNTSNHSTHPSTSASTSPTCLVRAAPTSGLSNGQTAGNMEPCAQGTCSNFHDNCTRVFAGLGAPECAGTQTEQQQPLLRNGPEQAAVPRAQAPALPRVPGAPARRSRGRNVACS